MNFNCRKGKSERIGVIYPTYTKKKEGFEYGKHLCAECAQFLGLKISEGGGGWSTPSMFCFPCRS